MNRNGALQMTLMMKTVTGIYSNNNWCFHLVLQSSLPCVVTFFSKSINHSTVFMFVFICLHTNVLYVKARIPLNGYWCWKYFSKFGVIYRFSNSVVGESALDRFACGIGGKHMLPHIIATVPQMLQNGRLMRDESNEISMVTHEWVFQKRSYY